MSQMPDKIWLHKDTKYNTGDVVCGYQYDFVQGIEDEGGIENFVEYINKENFIDKACSFLHHYQEYPNHDIATDKLVEAFKMYIEL